MPLGAAFVAPPPTCSVTLDDLKVEVDELAASHARMSRVTWGTRLCCCVRTRTNWKVSW